MQSRGVVLAKGVRTCVQCAAPLSKDPGAQGESYGLPLKGSFKGDIDTDVDVVLDIDSDMAASINQGSFQRVSVQQLMIEILRDLIDQSSRNYGNVVYVGSCGIRSKSSQM